MSHDLPGTHQYGERVPHAHPFRRAAAWAVLYAAGGLLTVLMLATSIQTYVLVDEVRGTQKSNTDVISSSEETLKVIEDCTQPKGKCYKDGQQRTADAVEEIGKAQAQASVYAAYCVKIDTTQSVALIEKCVKEQFRIAAGKKKN